jgi:hypothetical protein
MHAVKKGTAMTALPGWYPTRPGILRWWDGTRWTGMRVKNGVPGADWAALERPALAWMSVGLLLVPVLVQLWHTAPLGGFLLSRGGLGGLYGLLVMAVIHSVIGVLVTGTLGVLLGACWLAMAIQVLRVRRIPVPASPALVIDTVRPLPGEREGPEAGWYPMSSQVARWWTGARWAQYTGTRHGISPTFVGVRAARNLVRTAWVVAGIAGVGMLASVVVLIVGATVDDYGETARYGVKAIVASLVFGGYAAFVFALTRVYRRSLVAPPRPPTRLT